MLDQLGQKGRRESLDTFKTVEGVVFQEHRVSQVNLVSLVLMVRLVFLVQEALKVSLGLPVHPVPQGQWGAVVTDIKERKETRVTWVFLDPVVLLATGR